MNTLADLIAAVEARPVYFFLERAPLFASPLAEGNRTVWKARAAAPEKYEVHADTMEEAIRLALARAEEIETRPPP